MTCFKPIFLFILTILLSTSSLSINAQTTNLKINKSSYDDTKRTIERVESLDPDKPLSQKLKWINKSELVSIQENVQVKFSLKDKKVTLTNSSTGSISMPISGSNNYDSVDIQENKVVYSGRKSKVSVVLESVEGGVRQVINISTSDSPSFYDFPIEVESSDKVVKEDNGQVLIKNNKDQIKFAIAKPWAVDANKKNLNTWYTIESDNV